MKKTYTVNILELIYYISFSFYLILATLNTSMFSIPSGLSILVRIILLSLIIKLVLQKKYTISELIIYGVFVLISLLTWRSSHYANILDICLLIISSKDIPLKNILKIYIIIVSTLLVVMTISSLSGIIPNLQYVRGDTGAIRNSFGAVYPTDYAAHVFFLFTAITYYFAGKYNTFKIILGLVFATFIYKLCDARLDAFSILIVVVVIAIEKFFKNIQKLKLYKLFPFSMIIFMCVSLFFTLNYDSSSKLMSTINNLFSNRLILGYQGVKKYGITLFGQSVSFNGLGGTTATVLNYDFVDSSYIQMFIRYGIVYTLFFIALFTFWGFSRSRKKDVISLIIFTIISLNAIVAHHLVAVEYNFLILALFSNVDSITKIEDLKE